MNIHAIKLTSNKGELPKLRSFTPGPEASVQTRALVALLGGYNSQARGVDVETYHAIKAEFDQVLWKLSNLIEECTPNATTSNSAVTANR